MFQLYSNMVEFFLFSMIFNDDFSRMLKYMLLGRLFYTWFFNTMGLYTLGIDVNVAVLRLLFASYSAILDMSYFFLVVFPTYKVGPPR